MECGAKFLRSDFGSRFRCAVKISCGKSSGGMNLLFAADALDGQKGHGPRAELYAIPYLAFGRPIVFNIMPSAL